MNTKVVCGIIWKEGKVLIARRKPGKPMAGFWEFPGGKVENNEEMINALRRELFEEFSMKVEVHSLIGVNNYNDEEISIDLYGYSCVFINATFELTDHDQYAFVLPQDLNLYHLAPADIYFAELCKNKTKVI
jgi:8-oxo-dGTP diphosphatase